MRSAATAKSSKVELSPLLRIFNPVSRKPIRPQVTHNDHHPTPHPARLATAGRAFDESHVGILDQVLRSRAVSAGKSQRM